MNVLHPISLATAVSIAYSLSVFVINSIDTDEVVSDPEDGDVDPDGD